MDGASSGMKVIHQAQALRPAARAVAVAIGMFDGVHRGHQEILARTVQNAATRGATSLAVTFDRHPNAVLAPEHAPPLIYSLPQRLRAIESLGVAVAWVIPFDRSFSQIPAETFITSLARDFGAIESICVGADFTFGYRRGGNVAMLQRLGEEMGFRLEIMPPVLCEGLVISSTRIREAIRLGDVEKAGYLLGRAYATAGTVIRGNRFGHQLGFPTANLEVAGLALPPLGVYAGAALVSGRSYRAVANLGIRPTLEKADAQPLLEVHLLDFEGDLYGLELEFTYTKMLRSETKFPNLTALKEQISRDVVAARLSTP